MRLPAPQRAYAGKIGDLMEEIDADDYAVWKANRPTLTQERNHPNHWFNRGADLHASAGAIWYAMQHDSGQKIAEELGLGRGFRMSIACSPVYHMMCGLALEVTMKAVLVQRGTSFESTHKLSSLVDLLGVTRTPEQLAMLDFYEHCIVWSGRYPTPRRATDDKLKNYWNLASDVLTSPVRPSEESVLQLRQGNGAADWEDFTAVWWSYASLFKH